MGLILIGFQKASDTMNHKILFKNWNALEFRKT